MSANMNDPMGPLTPWFVQDYEGRSVEITVQSSSVNYDDATDQVLSVDVVYVVTLHENLYSGSDEFGYSVASHSYEAATLAEAIAGALAQRNDWALLDGQDAAEVEQPDIRDEQLRAAAEQVYADQRQRYVGMDGDPYT